VHTDALGDPDGAPAYSHRLLQRSIPRARRIRAGALGVYAEKPFFVYVAFTQMHPPLIHHPDFTGKSGGGTYSDTLAELDHRTGQILDAIEAAGIADNAIVVWNSDNPAGRATSMGGSNGPWRGHFGSGFEGGMRTPAVVCWPSKIPAGRVTDEIFAAVDWLPTLARMAGETGRVPTDRPIDGINSSDLLLGRSDRSNRDHVLFYGSESPVWDKYKPPFKFTGALYSMTVDVSGELITDEEQAMKVIMARQ
jgi:arylsulfatase